MLKNINFSEVDTTDEIAKEMNKIITEVNLNTAEIVNIKADLNHLMTKKRTRAKPKAKPKVKKKKGSVLMKTLVSLVILAVLLGGICLGQDEWPITYSTCSTPDQLVQLLTNRFSNQSGNYFTFGPTTTAPGHSAGRVYYHTVNGLYVSDGTSWDAIDTAGGLSLDGAYDVGNTITVDGSAVTLTAGLATNNGVLTLVQSNTGAYEGLKITNAGTDPSIEIDGTGTGDDITGTGDYWTVSEAGVGTFVGLIVGATDIVFVNSETIDNDDDGEITFSDATDDTAISWSGSTLQWTTDTAIDTVSWGDLDNHTGLTDITGDAADFTISHTGNVTGYDLLITQSGSGDNALTLTSGGTATDAIGLVSAAGITMTSTVQASSWTQTATGADDDLTIALAGAQSASLILSSAGVDADALSIFTSHANGDIKILSTDTIDIDAANGIAIDIAGTGGEDYVLTNTGGSIQLVQTEAVTDGINIDATGGVDIDSALDVAIDISTAASNFDVDVALGSIYLDAGEEDAKAIWLAATGTASGIDIDAGTIGVDVDSTGPIILTGAEDTADSIVINSATGGIDILCDAAAAGDDIDIANTGGSVNISSSENTDAAINIATSHAGGQIQITSTDTTDDGIEIDSSGGFDLDAADIITIDNSGSQKDITITSALGRVILTGTESAAAAVSLVADGTAGGINIDAKTSGVDIDAVGGSINLDTSGASKDIRLDAGSGAVQLDGGETGAAAILIDASHTDGGIDVDCGTTGFLLTADSGDIALHSTGDVSDLITITNTTGTGASAIGLVASAGGITAKVPNGKSLKLGNTGLDTYFEVAAHGTASTEFVKVVNSAGSATADGAEAIQITASAGGIGLQTVSATAGGPAETYENAAAITLLSDAGAISLHTEGNIEKAIQLVVDGGVDESIFIKADQGTDANSIELVSDVGGIKINSAGLVNNSAIQLVSGAGGVDIDAFEMFTVDVAGGTVGTADITLTNNRGTDVACIALLTSSGGIDINAKEVITIDLTGGTVGTSDIRITNAQGTDEAAIELTSTAGGVTLNTNAAKDFLVEAGQVLITGNHDTADCVFLHAEAGSSQTITIVNDEGTNVAAVGITATLGGVDINAKEMLTLDVTTGGTAGTADIIITNTPGTADDAIKVNAVAGGVAIDAAKSVVITSAEAQADALQITTSNGAGGIVLTSALGTISMSDDNLTNVGTLACNEITDDDDSAISYQIKTVTVQIEHVGGSGDFQWSTGAGHAAQNLDLSTIVPAYARVLDVTVICTESVVGQTNVLLTVGNASAGNQFIAQADCDTLNGAISSAAAGASFVAINISASKVWVGADPDDGNWTDQSAGTWAVMVTYIDNNAAKDN